MNIRDFWLWLKAEFRWRVLRKRYEIQLTEEAKRQLDELPEERQAEIRKAMERMSRNPYSGERTELEEEAEDYVMLEKEEVEDQHG
jgi:mRNA-degrading endonuclease RelE of RelBE toxin-antitoxin system